MAEALWFLANNFHWICGIYFRGKYSVCCQNWKRRQQQQQPMPSRYNGFWLQFMDVALSLPGCPAPPSLLSPSSACLLSKTLLFSGRATKRRPVTTAETSRTTGNTDRECLPESIWTEALCRRLRCWNCFIAEPAAPAPAQLTFTQIKFCDCFFGFLFFPRLLLPALLLRVLKAKIDFYLPPWVK